MSQVVGHDYGFINAALYKIGQSAPHYARAFHDVSSGTNAAMEFDIYSQPVLIPGYNAGTGWDAVTGLGSPKSVNLAGELAQYWSPGQGNATINNTKSHPKNPNAPGHMAPH